MVAYIVGYGIAAYSESYKVAVKHIYASPVITSNLGKVTNVRLAFFGYSVRYNGPHGWAEFEIIVRGEKDKGTIFIMLEREVGEWEVKSARLKTVRGESISIK